MFGYVRFQEVVNVEALETRLNIIWIETWKLIDNKPKYRRFEGTWKERKTVHKLVQQRKM